MADRARIFHHIGDQPAQCRLKLLIEFLIAPGYFDSEMTGELTEEFLYASDFLTPQDAAFMADVMGEKGAGAVAAHEGTSLLAKRAAAGEVQHV